MREQAALLNDVTNPAAEGVDIIGRDPFAVELDRAGIRLDQANDQTQQS